MAWGYEASFTIEHVNNRNKRLRCYDCFYFNELDKSCEKTPRYLPDDGYDSWKYCGKFEIKPSVSFKAEKLAQYNNYMRDKARRQASSVPTKKRTVSSAVVEEKPKIPNSFVHRYATPIVQQNKRVEARNTPFGGYLLSREERASLPLIVCGLFKRIPKPREKKLVGIKLDDGSLAQVEVYVAGEAIYYKKYKYPKEYLAGVRRAIGNN